MVIFLGNLPLSADERELCAVAKLPAGTHMRVIKKKTRHGDLVCFGLIKPESDRVARKLISRLNGRSCHGNTLVAREYYPRVAGNERRRLDWRQLPWDGFERRSSERRESLHSTEFTLGANAA